MSKKKPGRPARGKPRNRPLFLGRPEEEDRDLLHRAAEASGMTFTAWAMGILLSKAWAVFRPRRGNPDP